MSVLGDELRTARRRHGLTQAALARRAGTTQAAISRIESGAESPSFERFASLLMVLGERATIEIAPAACELEPGDIALARRLTPAQRLAESASWNLVATQRRTPTRQSRGSGADNRAARDGGRRTAADDPPRRAAHPA